MEHFLNAKCTVKIQRIVFTFYSWVSYVLFSEFLQMMCVEMKTPWPIFHICPQKNILGTWHLYPGSPGWAVHELEKNGNIGYTANWLCTPLTSLHHLCFPFRSVEDIHWRRSSNQPDVFKSCVQNRAWRFGQGFVPGKVWKGPLLRWDRQ